MSYSHCNDLRVLYNIMYIYSTLLQSVNRFTGALWYECICNTCNVTCLYKMWFTHKHTFAEYNTLRKGPVNIKGVSNRISVNAVDVTLFNIMYTYNACVPCNGPYIHCVSPSVPAPIFGFIYWNLFWLWFLEFSNILTPILIKTTISNS